MTDYLWNPNGDDGAEKEAAAQEAWDSSTNQSERIDAYLRIMNDAEQAHRPWVSPTKNEALRCGLGVDLKKMHDRTVDRMKVKLGDGRIVEKRRTTGIIRANIDGSPSWTQLEFDNCTVEDLLAKYDEVSRRVETNRDTLTMLGRLIALCRQTGAETPAKAAAVLGITVDEWLADEAAS